MVRGDCSLAEKGCCGEEWRHRIVPERFEKVYYNWLENIKDWCISRQLCGDTVSRSGIAPIAESRP